MGWVTSGETWRLGRRPALDGLRGIAVLLVLAYHAVGRFEFAAGSVGVTMFFTLSGFLITALLLQESRDRGRVSLGRFYARRARRLLPALAVFLAVVALLALASAPALELSQIPWVLLYVANWPLAFGHEMGASLSHMWSLAVEEQFYLFWPLVVIAARRPRIVAGVALIGATASFALRLALWSGGQGAERIYYATDTNIGALLVGAALAALMVDGWHPAARVTRWVWPAVAALAVLALSHDRFLLAPLLAPGITAVAIASICVRPSTRPLESRWITGVGKRSYGLYLWHLPLLWTAVPLLPWARPITATLALAATFVIAWASYRWVETPLLRRRASELRPEVGGLDVQHGVGRLDGARGPAEGAEAQSHRAAGDVASLDDVAL